MKAIRFACVLVCGCGRLLDDSDAGDGGHDASDASASDADASDLFKCGEGTIFVYCVASSEACFLLKTSQAHQYSCVQTDGGAPTCAGATQIALAAGDCGCYEAANGEVFVTVCK